MHQELDFSQMDMHKKVVSNVDIYTCQYFHSLFKWYNQDVSVTIVKVI